MKKLYEEAAVQDIADAIREKTGGAETYRIAQMGAAVRPCRIRMDTTYHRPETRRVAADL